MNILTGAWTGKAYLAVLWNLFYRTQLAQIIIEWVRMQGTPGPISLLKQDHPRAHGTGLYWNAENATILRFYNFIYNLHKKFTVFSVWVAFDKSEGFYIVCISSSLDFGTKVLSFLVHTGIQHLHHQPLQHSTIKERFLHA